VYESFNLIPSDLHKQFLKGIVFLENSIPKDKRDFPIGYKNQQWELVHPALYTFQNNKTPVVKEPIKLKDTIKSIGLGSPISLGND